MDDTPRLLLWGVPELRAGSAIVFSAERRFQLLVVLALQSGQWIERDRVAALLWPEHALPEARRNLRKVLFKARQLAIDLEVSAAMLRWPVSTDLQACDDDRRAGRLGAALARRRGEPLQAVDDPANAAFSAWLGGERARMDQLWHGIATDRLRGLADPAARLDAARALLTVDPLDEPAVMALVGAQQSLGRHDEAAAELARYASRLAETLGVEPSRALVEMLRPPAAASSARERRESAVDTDEAFIGRRTELAEALSLLARSECRMLTVLGPGGVGKSTLARRALAAAAATRAGRLHWIDLQDLAEVAQFTARLAQILGLDADDSQDPVPLLAHALAGTPTLLVLDNAEHLQGLPGLLAALLAAAPDVTLLLTSRVRTHIAAEWVLPLRGLAVPDDESRDIDAAASFDAVRLFEARAVAAQRSFRLADHIAAVIGIVEAVGGMPLAIELAASWVRLLPPAEIARDLRESIDLLERDPRLGAAPTRPEHDSMRAVLERSWQLLAPRERDALAALSVFRGGFTRAAAQRVAAVPLPLLSTLVDKSLLEVDETGRFSAHPLVTAFAAQRLEDDPSRLLEVRTRHAEHYALYLADLTPHATGDPRLLVAGVTAEYANCRLAWQTAVDGLRADLIYAMARSMWGYFEMRALYVEGEAWLAPALALPPQHPAAPRALTRLRNGLSMLLHRKGDHARALSMARGGIEMGEDCGDTEGYVGCLLNTAMCLFGNGQVDEARPYYERALAVSRQRGDRHCIMWSTGNLGVCLMDQGELDESEALLQQALRDARELGDIYNTAVNLGNLGVLQCSYRRQTEPAMALFQEELQHCRRHGLGSLENWVEYNIGTLLFQAEHFEDARQHLSAALARCRTSGQMLYEWACERLLAQLDIRDGQWASAARRLERIVTAQHARAIELDLVLAVGTFAELLAAMGRAPEAAALWEWSLARNVIDAPSASRMRARLAALPLPVDPGASVLPAPTIESILAQLRALATG